MITQYYWKGGAADMDEYRIFIKWIREQSEMITALKMNGYSEAAAVEMLKVYELNQLREAVVRTQEDKK